MSKERVEQVEGAGASVPMTDISNIDVPEGTDELSRSTRRACSLWPWLLRATASA